ncbi:MAG TPA: MFS transporter [Macromonas sp.]|nr:MFS transporter [Macromonas sp.]
MNKGTACSAKQAGLSALVLAALGMVPVHMDAALVALALPAFQEVFGVRPHGLANLLKVHLLCFLLGLWPCGLAVDRGGAWNVFRAGAMVVVVGATWGLMAASWGAILFARGVQGIGCAALLSSAAPLLFQSAAEGQRSQALARWSTLGALTYAVSPLLGSGGLKVLGWQMLFAIPLLASGLAVAVALCCTPPAVARPAASTQSGTGWWQGISRCCVIGGLINLGFMPTFFLIGLLTRQADGSALLLPLTLSLPVGGVVAEFAVRRLGAPRTLLASLSLAGCGQAVLGLVWHAGLPHALLALPLASIGLGCAVAAPALLSIMLERESQGGIGKTMSLLALARQAGSLAGVAAVGYLLGDRLAGAQAWVAGGLALPYLFAAVLSTSWLRSDRGVSRSFLC